MYGFAVTTEAEPSLILSKTAVNLLKSASQSSQCLKLWMNTEDGGKMGKLYENNIVLI